MLANNYGEVILHYLSDDDSFNPNSLYIEDFRIKPKFRRKGYGRLLFKGVEEFAKKINADYIELNTVPQAIDFWHKMGFRLTEEPVEGLRPTMVKEVGIEPEF